MSARLSQVRVKTLWMVSGRTEIWLLLTSSFFSLGTLMAASGSSVSLLWDRSTVAPSSYRFFFTAWWEHRDRERGR